MSLTLQISMIVAELVYFAMIFYFLRKKMLSIKYSLLWLVFGIVMIVFTSVPSLMWHFMWMFGVASPMNGLFSVLLFFILTIIMSLTAIVSRQSERIRALVQSQALLEERIRELEVKKDEH